jgi:hypothetical protein
MLGWQAIALHAHNGFSKKLDNHIAAIALYLRHYNFCRVHEALSGSASKAICIADRA